MRTGRVHVWTHLNHTRTLRLVLCHLCWLEITSSIKVGVTHHHDAPPLQHWTRDGCRSLCRRLMGRSIGMGKCKGRCVKQSCSWWAGEQAGWRAGGLAGHAGRWAGRPGVPPSSCGDAEARGVPSPHTHPELPPPAAAAPAPTARLACPALPVCPDQWPMAPASLDGAAECRSRAAPRSRRHSCTTVGARRSACVYTTPASR